MKEHIKECYSTIDDNMLAYKFATYVIATNRLYLKELTGKDKISGFPQDFTQFIVIYRNSEANRRFSRLRKLVV